LQLPALRVNIREIKGRANTLLHRIGEARRSRQLREMQLDALKRALLDALDKEHMPKIQELAELEDSLVDEFVELVLPHFVLLVVRRTKMIRLQAGEVRMRDIQARVDIEDGETEEAVIRRIKRLRGMKQFTKRGKITLDRKALARHPKFVERVKGLRLVGRTVLIISPAKTPGSEIERDISQRSVTINED
jgi:hypothetical protein